MRVLHVSSGLDPRTGGTATAAISVALAARRAGIAVDLAYPVEPGTEAALAPSFDTLASAGVGLRGFYFSNRGGRRAVRWGMSADLDKFLFAEAARYDVVHAHSLWVASTVNAVRAARRAKRPVVVMPHEGLTRFDMAQGGNAGLRLAKRMLRRWYLRKVDRFVFSTEFEARDSLVPGGVAIPHPVIDELGPRPPKRPRATPGLVVGFLGRFHPKKNLELLIRAMARTPFTVNLKIGGGGEAAYEAALRALVTELGLDDRVTWAGFVGAADKTAFYQSVDVIAMPSQFECFGLVGAEALGAGTPVILSPTVGIAELLEGRDCGLVVPPRADALAAAITRLAGNDDLVQWRRYARLVALELFSYAAHGARLKRLYEQLAPVPGPASGP